MIYSGTTGVILYWKLGQTFVIHRDHHAWFDEYNSYLFMEEKHTTGSLLLKQYPKSLLHNLALINLIPCELDIISTPFCDTKTLTYEIELPTSGKKNWS